MASATSCLTGRKIEFEDVFLRDVVEMFHERSQSIAMGGNDHLTTFLHARIATARHCIATVLKVGLNRWRNSTSFPLPFSPSLSFLLRFHLFFIFLLFSCLLFLLEVCPLK